MVLILNKNLAERSIKCLFPGRIPLIALSAGNEGCQYEPDKGNYNGLIVGNAMKYVSFVCVLITISSGISAENVFYSYRLENTQQDIGTTLLSREWEALKQQKPGSRLFLDSSDRLDTISYCFSPSFGSVDTPISL